MRIAILSTPRTGTTVLSRALAQLVDGPRLATHLPREVDWDGLPESCVLTVHWYPVDARWERHEEARLADHLREHGFRTVTITRPADDVLASIAQFAPREPYTGMWLAGTRGNEDLLRAGLDTAPLAFARYAASARFAALLRVTVLWSQEPGTEVVAYADIAADLSPVLAAVQRRLGVRASVSAAEVAASIDFDADRAATPTGHYWRGTPGAGRSLPVPVRAACRVALRRARIRRLPGAAIG